MTALSPKHGGCHCGAVKWEADLPDDVIAHECNCSLCGMLGFQHVIVPKSRFRLLTGEETLTTYTFGTGVAQHTFCSRCGVKSHYVPPLEPRRHLTQSALHGS